MLINDLRYYGQKELKLDLIVFSKFENTTN